MLTILSKIGGNMTRFINIIIYNALIRRISGYKDAKYDMTIKSLFYW